MTQQIRQTRSFTHQLVTIVANTCSSDIVDVRPFHTMLVHTPGAWTAASLGFTVSPVRDTTFTTLYVNPVGVSCTVRAQLNSVTAAHSYVAPAAVGAAGFVRLRSLDETGAGVDQGADRIIGVSLKG